MRNESLAHYNVSIVFDDLSPEVIPLSITHMLIKAVETGDLDAVAEIIAIYGFDENADEVTE